MGQSVAGQPRPPNLGPLPVAASGCCQSGCGPATLTMTVPPPDPLLSYPCLQQPGAHGVCSEPLLGGVQERFFIFLLTICSPQGHVQQVLERHHFIKCHFVITLM